MLQDILFALLGFTGDIIVSVEDEAVDLHLTSPCNDSNNNTNSYNNLSDGFQSSTAHTYSNHHNDPNPNQQVPSTANTLNNTDARRNAKKTPYFHVKDGYDLLRDAEREMINKIVPLGWFYLQLQEFCARLDIGWGGAMLYGQAEQAATAAATTTAAAGRSEISGFGSRSSHILGTGARSGNSSHSVGGGVVRDVYKREVYKAAVARGLEDLLNEYVADVTYFEQLSLHHHNHIEQQQQHQYQLDGVEQRQQYQEEMEDVFEAQLPLSQVLQHFQKYLLVFPQIWDILTEMEGKGLRGCQLLDFFTQKSISSGVPVVTVVLNRIILRLRAVFLKQTFSWMVFGTLEDPALEYFIQPKQVQNSHKSIGVSSNFPGNGVASNVNNNKSMYARVIERLYNSQNNNNGKVGKGVIGRGSGVRVAGFDWATSYVLKLELIPDTHTSARTVAQILFAGKGVKLVQQTVKDSGMDSGNGTNNSTTNNSSFDTVDVYRYLSAGYNQSSSLPPFLSAEAKEKTVEQQPQQQQSATSFSSSPRTNHGGITLNKDIFGQKNTSSRTHLGAEGPSNGENPSASLSKSSSFVQFSGFELHEIEDFTRSFAQILHIHEHSHADAEGNGHIHDIGEAVDLLEKAVEQIHDIMAHRLWKLLKEKLNFGSFVQVIRNTFLVGKGELVQNILEGVHELTKQPVNYPSIATRNTAFWANTPGSSSLFSPSQTRSSIFAEGESKNVMENLLNRQVLANSGKLVGLEPEHLQDFLTLGLNNQNLSIRDFSGHHQQQQQGEEDKEVFFSGAAVCQPSHSEIENEKFANDSQNPHTTYSTTTATINNNNKLRTENLSKNPQFSSQRMVPISTVVSLCTPIGTSASQDFQEIWAAYLCQQTTFGVSSAQQYGYTRAAAAAAAAAKLNSQRFATVPPKDDSKEGAAGEGLQNFEEFKNDENLQFCTGGVWLSDAKHVVKGFAFSSDFLVVNWGKIRELMAVMAMRLALHHISTANYADPNAEIDGIGSFEYELALGSFFCVLHGDRKQLTGFLSGGGRSLSNYAQQYNGVSFLCKQKQRKQHQQGGVDFADEYSHFETSTNNYSGNNNNNNNNNNNSRRESTAGRGGGEQGRERGGGVGVAGLPPLPAGALSVGVSFHALITHTESDKLDYHGPKTGRIPEIRYFARVFVRESSSSRSAAQLRSSSYLNNSVVGQDSSERDGMLAEALIDLDNNFYEPALAHTEKEQQRENEGEKEVVTSEETILRELTTHSLAPAPSSSLGVRQDKQDSSDRGAEETETEKEQENEWQSENVMKRLAAVRAQISRSVESGGISCLEIEYTRELVPSSSFSSHKNSQNWSAGSNFLSPPPGSYSSSAQSMGNTSGFSDFGSRMSGVPGHSTNAVVYKLRARLNAHEMFSRKQKHALRKQERGILSENGGKSAGKHPEKDWDVEVALDVNTYVRCVAGQAYIGAVGSGLCIPIPSSSSPFGGGDSAHDSSKSPSTNTHPENFNIHVFSISFRGRSALSSYPVASPFTATRYPDTFLRLEREMAQLRAWMHLKLRIRFPDSRFQTIFDPEAMRQYERIFAFIMKVRLVAHALEKLWIARSRLISDRIFCLMRHSMHFFLSNLLYYLQVDVVDSEFCEFQRAIDESADFPSVLRAHRNFLANVLRVSLIDNLSVQEGLERVLQVCLRFVAVCRILHQAESHQASADIDPASILQPSHTPRGERGERLRGGRTKQQQQQQLYPQEQDQQQQHHGREEERERGETIKGGYADPLLAYPALIFVPPEEFAAIHKDFYNQVAFLFQIMRKVESRGFLFRLDFNGFLSRMAASNGTTAAAASGVPYRASSY